MCDLINSPAVIKPGHVTVQNYLNLINRTFAYNGHVLFKKVEGLFTPSDLMLEI